MKRLIDWEGSGVPLDQFFGVGDAVDSAFAEYLLGVLPGAVFLRDAISVGEPQDHRGEGGQPRYGTVVRIDGRWHWAGYWTAADVRSGAARLALVGGGA
ncbi:MAG: hypothetical protein GY719_34935 [bacterium]|nr:hypothetical protein [bacterium]